MSDEIRKPIEEIAEAADYSEDDTPFKLRDRLDAIRDLARQTLGEGGG